MVVSRTLENFKQNSKNGKMFKTFEPFIYNIWNTQKGWTQEQIADGLKVTQQTVSNIIENFTKNGEIAKICKNFEPFIYNI